jgi:thioredoxin reductase
MSKVVWLNLRNQSAPVCILEPIIFVLFTYYFLLGIATHCFGTQQIYPWAVVGAGPAGIITVAMLLENGVAAHDIAWIDEVFGVGRLGKYYGNVLSNHTNTPGFFSHCLLFKQILPQTIHARNSKNQQKKPLLHIIVEPLQDITNYLRAQVISYTNSVQAISRDTSHWHLELSNADVYAHKVVLATGSHPKKLSCQWAQEIPLDSALDRIKLQPLIDPNDTVMIVGSGQSALLILKYLSEIPVQKIISLYKKTPITGALRYGIMEQLTTEKGGSKSPEDIISVVFNQETFECYGRQCTKVIYALGYEHNAMVINGSATINFDYKTGTIEHNLYGIGIAFPELHVDKKGTAAPLVAIDSFMAYAQKMVPQWMRD